MYVAMATLLVAIEVWWWSSVTYGGSNVSAIRAQEVYAWLSLSCLLLAVSIGPMLRLFPAIPGKGLWRDARRLIGIAAATFAVLHVGIAYIDLFQAPNPLTLADIYKKSFGLGVTALLILIAMAVTSFDRAFFGMGIWWFRLHRLVYVALLAVGLHAFMVGSHANSLGVLILLSSITLLLLIAHAIAMIRSDKPASNLQIVTISCAVLFAAAVLNYGLTQHLGHNFFLHGKDPESHLHD